MLDHHHPYDVLYVKPLAEYKIYVEIKNGTRGVFDMQPYIEKLPASHKLRHLAYFNQVTILYGDVTWPDGEDIAPETLVCGLVPA